METDGSENQAELGIALSLGKEPSFQTQGRYHTYGISHLQTN